MVIPWPWPPRKSLKLLEHPLQDGKLITTLERNGCVRVQIIVDGGASVETTSCPIYAFQPNAMTLIVTWAYPHIRIFFNGHLTAATDGAEGCDTKLTEYWLTAPIQSQERMLDLSNENEKAIGHRRDRLAGWAGGSRPKASRTRGGKDYAFASLRSELSLVRDHLEAIGAGKDHHIPGLAARLRMLVVAGNPLPLLQMCAAMVGAPLIVYTAAQPRLPLPKLARRPVAHIRFNISAQPTILLQNPIDLDVWLELPNSETQDGILTNRNLLKKIGDTVGSHLDLDIHRAVSDLRALSSDWGQGDANFLEKSLRDVAEAVAKLSEEVLAREND